MLTMWYKLDTVKSIAIVLVIKCHTLNLDVLKIYKKTRALPSVCQSIGQIFHQSNATIAFFQNVNTS